MKEQIANLMLITLSIKLIILRLIDFKHSLKIILHILYNIIKEAGILYYLYLYMVLSYSIE